MKFSQIKIVIFDCDGVLTDGIYQISESGEVTKSFYTRDFEAIQKLMCICRVMIVTQSYDRVINKQIERICSHSKIWSDAIKGGSLSVFTGVDNKVKIINDELIERGLGWDQVAYIGDAANDLECMKKAYYSGCPSDAIESVRDWVNYESDFPGGRGAVADFCDYIYKENDKENR